MIIPMKGHAVRSVKHSNWYEVTVHIAVYDGIEMQFQDTIEFDTKFDDSIATEALRLIGKGSKK